MQKKSETPFYTPSQLAAYLGVSSSTIWRWRKAGALPASLQISGRHVWRKADIAAWIAQRGDA